MIIHYKSISQIKAMARESGSCFFTRDTMRFWGSVVYPNVRTGTSGWYFITSENQFNPTLPRRYTVRKLAAVYTEHGRNIETVGKFQEFSDFDSALRQATALAALEKLQEVIE